MNKGELIKEIKELEEEIAYERKVNRFSGTISFLEYQLKELKDKLKIMENDKK